MTGREVATVASATSSLASTLLQLGNNYYASTAAWREFPLQVKLLQERHNGLAAQLEKYGQDVGPVLLEAQKLLQKEVETLTKRRYRVEKNGCQKLCGVASLATTRVRETLFPEKIGLVVGDAIKAYDRIGEELCKQKENEENIRSRASKSVINLPFYDDDCYVPLERTESKISVAISPGEAGSPVILLCGAPGTGKSTLTRRISLKYKSDFTHVVWLECGPSPDFMSVELRLLQDLGWSHYHDVSGFASFEDVRDEWHLRRTIKSRLQNVLRAQKLLIVLDDLEHPQILQDLLICSGPNVKYLITSQRDDICNSLTCNFERFEIENLGARAGHTNQIGKKMLAVHIGYKDGNKPDHLQDMADRILDQAQGVPLVIATFGAQLGKADYNDLAVWQCLLDYPSQFLVDRKPMKCIHGVPYSNSCWSALSQSISGVGNEEKQLLLLLGSCKDGSIPEVVLFFLLSCIFSEEKSNILQFSR